MINGTRTRRTREEEGFTLIELMVVVLILGILMAIAIPTFLSLTGSAKANAAQADLTTASEDESIYFTQYGDFDANPSANTAADNIQVGTVNGTGANTPGMKGTDPGINWTTYNTGSIALGGVSPVTSASAGTKTVWVDMLSSTGLAIILGTAASNGNTYWVSDNAGTLTYAYNLTSAAIVPLTPTASWYTSFKAATAVTP
jgi:prepilin-type N-terminal cleavage/methylation domain-containing protein